MQNVTPIPVKDGKSAPIGPSRSCSRLWILMSSTTRRNVLFKTTDGGQNWQTISPDLTRPEPRSAGQRR